ncbi:hypothetical protein N9Y15_02465 [Alphaproteobacteria bacterium]|nr:hypothetical protein [Alphaproteobacteria bacterium]MDB2575051.1 hypothetical protein [Alphaproteobacteria bacterium]
MRSTDAILIVGFLFLGIIAWFGFQSIAQNSPKTDFEACMEEFSRINESPDNRARLAALAICSGGAGN